MKNIMVTTNKENICPPPSFLFAQKFCFSEIQIFCSSHKIKMIALQVGMPGIFNQLLGMKMC